jgi:hypothetical protein
MYRAPDPPRIATFVCRGRQDDEIERHCVRRLLRGGRRKGARARSSENDCPFCEPVWEEELDWRKGQAWTP